MSLSARNYTCICLIQISMQGLPNLLTAAQAPSSAYPASNNALRLYGMPACWLAALTKSECLSTLLNPQPALRCPHLE